MPFIEPGVVLGIVVAISGLVTWFVRHQAQLTRAEIKDDIHTAVEQSEKRILDRMRDAMPINRHDTQIADLRLNLDALSQRVVRHEDMIGRNSDRIAALETRCRQWKHE